MILPTLMAAVMISQAVVAPFIGDRATFGGMPAFENSAKSPIYGKLASGAPCTWQWSVPGAAGICYAVQGPYSTAINLSVDLKASTDTRDGAWGGAAAYGTKVTLKAPAGYRARVLRVDGDFIAWPKTGSIAPGASVEVGFGLKTTAPDGSNVASFPGSAATPYDNSFVWVQDALLSGQQKTRIPIKAATEAGGLLGPDNTMILQSFIALDSTGLTIHMEPTVVVVFQFEKEIVQ